MTKFDFGRTLAAIACTIVFSAAAVIGAVGPANAVTARTASARSGVTPSAGGCILRQCA